ETSTVAYTTLVRSAAEGAGGSALAVGGLDLFAGDAQQVDDGVQVGDVHRGVGLRADHRLGVERDAEAGGAKHVQVVGAVADGDRLGERDAGLLGEALQGDRLALAVDDRADQAAG